ncbi:MAG: type II toxin-antitoxin system VapC family toxin [Pseudonocardiales bacterium]
MVLDTSAVVAILFDEPGRRALNEAIEADPVRLISAANLLECALVVEARRGEPAGRELDLLLHRVRVDTVPVTADHVEIARQAWRRYGKGRHPAALNFGDCFAYALARSSGEALLHVGEDFARTDVSRVGINVTGGSGPESGD